jgi:hypothetical protein
MSTNASISSICQSPDHSQDDFIAVSSYIEENNDVEMNTTLS